MEYDFNSLPLAIVRLNLHHNGSYNLFGLGFFIDERNLITCKHVIDDVKKIFIDYDVESNIYIDYLQGLDDNELESVYIQHQFNNVDLALLSLSAPKGKCSTPARMGLHDNNSSQKIRCFGITSADKQGHWIDGEIIGPTVNGLCQFESNSGYRPEKGFSGTPVWVNEIKAVVGMVVNIDRNPEPKSGRFIPIHIIFNILKEKKIHLPISIKSVSELQELSESKSSIMDAKSILDIINDQIFIRYNALEELKNLHHHLQNLINKIDLVRTILRSSDTNEIDGLFDCHWKDVEFQLKIINEFSDNVEHIYHKFPREEREIRPPYWYMDIDLFCTEMNKLQNEIDRKYYLIDKRVLELWHHYFSALCYTDDLLRDLINKVNGVARTILEMNLS